MKKNIGSMDRSIRYGVAVVLAALCLTGVFQGITMWVALGVAVVMAVTATASTCPLYIPFRIDTSKKS